MKGMNKKMLIPTVIWFAMLSSHGLLFALTFILPKGAEQIGLEVLQYVGFAMVVFGAVVGGLPQIWKNPKLLTHPSGAAIPPKLFMFYIVALALTDFSAVMGVVIHIQGVVTPLPPTMNIAASAIGMILLFPTPKRFGLVPSGPSNQNPMVKIE